MICVEKSTGLLISPAICYLVALGIFFRLTKTVSTCKNGDGDNVCYIGLKVNGNV